MIGIATKTQLIEAAKWVAEDPSDANISELLEAAFNLPFDEMPREFLDSPVPLMVNSGKSIGDQLRRLL